MKKSQFIIYGAGNKGQQYLDFLKWRKMSDKVYAFCDKRSEELKKVKGKRVISYDEASSLEMPFLISCADSQVADEIYNMIKGDGREVFLFDDFYKVLGEEREVFLMEWGAYYYAKCSTSRLLSTFFPKYNTQRTFKKVFGRKIDLKNPIEINDKIQWLKFNTYYRNDVITQCVDKYRVREYLVAKGMGDLLPKLYGVYNKGEDIEWNNLPSQFVIKCNHGCGYNILCADKDKLNQNNAVKQLRYWLREDYWKLFAEVQYKYVKKKIIVEEYLGDNLSAYKFYCFNGVPKFLYVSTDSNGIKDYYYDYFDMDWDRLPYLLGEHKHYPGEISKPDSFEKMKEIAEKLSKDFPFVRVDLYDVRGKVYFSELTFIPTGGFMNLKPKETAKEWGVFLDLSLD